MTDRPEDRIRDAFGSSRPRVDVGFTVTVFGFSYFFNIGSIDLPFNSRFSILRDAIETLDFYQTGLRKAAAALTDAFRESLNLEKLEDQRGQKKAERPLTAAEHPDLNRQRGCPWKGMRSLELPAIDDGAGSCSFQHISRAVSA